MSEQVPEIKCIWCSAPWSEENLQVYDVRVSEGCDTCGYGAGATISIDIKCHACNRLMYRKEGLEVKG
jgi:hypothetical protein